MPDRLSLAEATVDPSPSFGAHLSRLNARRLRAGSWYFALVMVVLLVANIVLPSLRLWQHALVQAVVVLYFVGLGFVCRSARATQWSPPILPLLFGGATASMKAGSFAALQEYSPVSG